MPNLKRKFRPWGTAKWAFSLDDSIKWHFVGTLGTEERSLCSWKLVKNIGILSGNNFIRINDIESTKYRKKNAKMLKEREAEFKNLGGFSSAIEDMDIMHELFKISEKADELEASNNSIILDITSMPKRFFFVLLKNFIKSKKVKNLVVNYSLPKLYTHEDIYENIESWKHLPGFGGIDRPDKNKKDSLITSVGFMVESLKRYLIKNPNHEEIIIFIPFPAPLEELRKIRKSIFLIMEDSGPVSFNEFNVDILNISSAFDRIISLSPSSDYPVSFAPFGPKPISVAMCLYAIQKNSPVYYPQPTSYHPEYTSGILHDDPEKATYAYWIKYKGKEFYKAD